MPFPVKICAICEDEFELKPGKPGLAIHCPSCTEEEKENKANSGPTMDADERRMQAEADAERRKAIRDLLYRKDS
jgi:sarcosine oxidase delta subunit